MIAKLSTELETIEATIKETINKKMTAAKKRLITAIEMLQEIDGIKVGDIYDYKVLQDKSHKMEVVRIYQVQEGIDPVIVYSLNDGDALENVPLSEFKEWMEAGKLVKGASKKTAVSTAETIEAKVLPNSYRILFRSVEVTNPQIDSYYSLVAQKEIIDEGTTDWEVTEHEEITLSEEEKANLTNPVAEDVLNLLSDKAEIAWSSFEERISKLPSIKASKKKVYSTLSLSEYENGYDDARQQSPVYGFGPRHEENPEYMKGWNAFIKEESSKVEASSKKKAGADLYCPGCGENLGKATECPKRVSCPTCGMKNIKNPASLYDRDASKIEAGRINGPGVPDGRGRGPGRGRGRSPGRGRGNGIPDGTGPFGGTEECPINPGDKEADKDIQVRDLNVGDEVIFNDGSKHIIKSIEEKSYGLFTILYEGTDAEDISPGTTIKNVASKKADAPEEEPKKIPTKFKQLKIKPQKHDIDDIKSPTTEMTKAFDTLQEAQLRIKEITSTVDEMKIRFEEEKKRIEQLGGKVAYEKQLKDSIESLGDLVENAQIKTVSLGDYLSTLKQETKDKPFKPTDKWKLEKVVEKFPAAVAYLEKAVAGAQNMSTTEDIRELIIWPKKTSADDKDGFFDKITDVYDNMKNFFKELVNLTKEVKTETQASKEAAEHKWKVGEEVVLTDEFPIWEGMSATITEVSGDAVSFRVDDEYGDVSTTHDPSSAFVSHHRKASKKEARYEQEVATNIETVKLFQQMNMSEDDIVKKLKMGLGVSNQVALEVYQEIVEKIGSKKKESFGNPFRKVEVGDNVKLTIQEPTKGIPQHAVGKVIQKSKNDKNMVGVDFGSGNPSVWVDIKNLKVVKEEPVFAMITDTEDGKDTPSGNLMPDAYVEPKKADEINLVVADAYAEFEAYELSGESKEVAIEDFKVFNPGVLTDREIQNIADDVYDNKEAGGQVDRTKDQRETPSGNLLDSFARNKPNRFMNIIARQLSNKKKFKPS